MNLDFDKVGGLIPAIIQDNETNKVLMLGYMNQEALDKTKAIRMLVINDMTRDGTQAPSSVGELRVLNEYLNSTDDAIIRSAETRIKQESAVNQDSMRDMVAEMMLNMASARKAKVTKRTTSVILDTDIIPEDMVYGEADIEAETLTLSQFVEE